MEHVKTRPEDRIDFIPSIPFFTMHLAAVPALWTAPTKTALIVLFFTYFVRMFAITGGYHRYFSHKAYKTSRAFQFFLAFLGCTCAQKGPMWWAGHHRHHHKFSDLEDDIHSPTLRGFWWSHWGWILCARYLGTQENLVPDLAKYPELRWLGKYHHVPAIILAVTLFALGGWNVLLWGFFVSTVILWHSTFTINSLSHVFGSRRYKTTDTSKNNFFLALLTMGEGWHNNHHHYMSAARQGFFWWELDASYYILKVLSWFGLVWDLRPVPKEVLEQEHEAADSALPVAPLSIVKTPTPVQSSKDVL